MWFNGWVINKRLTLFIIKNFVSRIGRDFKANAPSYMDKDKNRTN